MVEPPPSSTAIDTHQIIFMALTKQAVAVDRVNDGCGFAARCRHLLHRGCRRRGRPRRSLPNIEASVSRSATSPHPACPWIPCSFVRQRKWTDPASGSCWSKCGRRCRNCIEICWWRLPSWMSPLPPEDVIKTTEGGYWQGPRRSFARQTPPPLCSFLLTCQRPGRTFRRR